MSQPARQWYCMTINILGTLHDTLAVEAESETAALAKAREHGFRPTPSASVCRIDEYGLRFVGIVLPLEAP